jgi:hypothetical protein
MYVDLCKPKIILIQCIVRQYLAKKKLYHIQQALLQEYNTFMEEYDFYSSNEYQNWKWFGMIKEDNPVSSIVEAETLKTIAPPPCVSLIEMNLPTSFTSTTSMKVSPPLSEDEVFNTEKQVLKDYCPIQSIQDNEFVSILEMIPFPDIPPNCLYPINEGNTKKILLSYNPSLLLYEEEEKLRRKRETADHLKTKEDETEDKNEINEDERSDFLEGKDMGESGTCSEFHNDLIIINDDNSLEMIKFQNETILKNLITKNKVIRSESDSTHGDELFFGFALLDYNDLSKDMRNGLHDIIMKKLAEVTDVDTGISDVVLEKLTQLDEESFFMNLSRKYL